MINAVTQIGETTNRDIIRSMIDNFSIRYFVVSTKFSKHHIDKTTYQDRGKIRWIAETNHEAFEFMDKDNEARTSHVDGSDLFPRLYFLADSFINEFFVWLRCRGLTITDIEAPRI